MSSPYHILNMAVECMSDDEPEVMLIKGHDFYRRWHQTIFQMAHQYGLKVQRLPKKQTLRYQSISTRVQFDQHRLGAVQ